MSLEVAEFAENISNPTPKNKIGRAKIWNWDKTNIKGRSSQQITHLFNDKITDLNRKQNGQDTTILLYIYIAIMLQINHIGDEITFVHRE